MEAFFIVLIVVLIIWFFFLSDKKSKKETKIHFQNFVSKPSNSSVQINKIETTEELFSKYVKLAKNCLENKDFNLAISYYDKAINLKPSESFCFNNRAYCKSKINDFKGSIEDYSKAIEINKNEAQYFANRGMTYWKWGKKAEAINDWQNASILGLDDAREWLSQIGYYKNKWKEFKNIILQEEIDSLYHFTDIANLDSIIKYGGLFSWYTCKIKGINIPVPGGNELSRDLDSRKNIQDYVRLSFNKKQPMLYVAQREGRIINPFFLEISPEVIFFKDTLFSDENATANSAIIGSELEDFQRINFNFAKSGEWSDALEKKYVQAEVLIKSHIPIKFIKNL